MKFLTVALIIVLARANKQTQYVITENTCMVIRESQVIESECWNSVSKIIKSRDTVSSKDNDFDQDCANQGFSLTECQFQIGRAHV